MAVERKFNKLRKPLYQKRQEQIRKIDKENQTKFWWTAFQKHPMLAPMLSPEGDPHEYFLIPTLSGSEILNDET